MAIYEYICKQCKERFTVIQSRYALENDIECPECISREVKKIMVAKPAGLGAEAGLSYTACLHEGSEDG